MAREREELLRLLDTGTTEELYERANRFFDSRDYVNAFQFYQAVLNRDRDHLGALVNIGVCARRLGDVDGAVSWYDRALAVSPNDVVALQNRIVAGMMLGRLDETITFAERLTTLTPGDPHAHQQLGRLYLESGHFSGAVRAFRDATTLDSGNAELHYQLGVASAANDDFRAADRSLAEALRLNPDLRAAYAPKVQVLMFLEQYDAAWNWVAAGQTRGAMFDPDLILELQRLSGQVGPR